jgi:hypothetical protein
VRHRHGALRGGRVRNLWHDDPVGAEIERALYEERVGSRRTHDRARAAAFACSDRGFQRREVVAAMLAVEEHEVEAGGGERADHLGVGDHRPDAGKRLAPGEFHAERVSGSIHGMMRAVEGTIDEGRAFVRGFYGLPASRAPCQVPTAANSLPHPTSPMNRAMIAMPAAAGAVA